MIDLPKHTFNVTSAIVHSSHARDATSAILDSMWVATRDALVQDQGMYTTVISETWYGPKLQLRFSMDIEEEMER